MRPKRYYPLYFTFCVIVLAVSFSPAAWGLDNEVTMKMGYSFFQGEDGWEETMVLGHDSSRLNGMNYALEWTMFPVDFFGIRLTLEYFADDVIVDWYDYEHDYRNRRERTLLMIPMTVSAKWRIPTPIVSPYFYAGIGFYTWGIYEGDGDNIWFDNNDNDLDTIQQDETIGFQVGTGIQFNMAPDFGFIMELEYRGVDLEYYRYRDETDIDASAVLFTTGIIFG